jgi:sugar phosphate isomerase/epimerase
VKRAQTRFRIAAAALGLAGALSCLALLLFLWGFVRAAGSPEARRVDVIAGESPGSLVGRLAEAGLTASPRLLGTYLRVFAPPALVPGRHVLPGNLSSRELAKRLARASGRATAHVVIPEGFNRFDIAKRLRKEHVAFDDAFIEASQDKELLHELGIEAVNRYENHIINTAAQAVALVERIGLDNVFVHLDTYHMNIEEKGMGNGIITARDHLKYIHLSESDRGTPGEGNCHWDETFATLAAIDFKGGLAMESFINMDPLLAFGLSVWRPVADSETVVMGNGLPFLRNKARQYGLIK